MLEQFKNMFIDEVKDILSDFQNDLLLLEKNPDDPQILERLYRYMHTIKGAAGMYGMDIVVDLAHKYEDIIKKIQNNQLQTNKNIISLGLKVRDLVEELLQTDQASDVVQKVKNLASEFAPLLSEKEEFSFLQNKLASYYILFEPNSDIYERNVNLSNIIEDLQKFQFKKITAFDDPSREQKGKLPIFWEIIIATDNQRKLSNLFLFVQDEVRITRLCDCNIFQINNFESFYNQLGPDFYPQRLEKIWKFIEQNSQKQQNTEKNTQTTNTTSQLSEQKINSIRVPSEKLDQLLNLVGQLVVSSSLLLQINKHGNRQELSYQISNLQKLIDSLKELTFSLRLVPIGVLFSQYQRYVRDLSLKLGKKVRFVAEGTETLVDKTMLEKLYSPLLHLIRNAIDHGIESEKERLAKGKSPEGLLKITALYSPENHIITIQIHDDGRGIDWEKVRKKAVEKGLIPSNKQPTKQELTEFLFITGFSTSDNVTSISGRGVGMNVVRYVVRELGGTLEIDSEQNLGTIITIKLPISISIIKTLHVISGKWHFLIPIIVIDHCERIKYNQLQLHSGNRIIYNDQIIPFIDFAEIFGSNKGPDDWKKIIFVNIDSQKIALLVDDILEEQNSVVKNLGSILHGVDYFLGASVLGDGTVAFIIDVFKLKNYLKLKQ